MHSDIKSQNFLLQNKGKDGFTPFYGNTYAQIPEMARMGDDMDAYLDRKAVHINELLHLRVVGGVGNRVLQCYGRPPTEFDW